MSDPDRYCQQARACLALRDEVGAAQWIDRALAIRPDHADSLHLAGLLAGRAGRDSDCIALLHRAIVAGSAGQKEASGLLLAAAHERAGRMAGARQALSDVLDTTPHSAQALLKLGVLLHRQGHPAQAVPLLRRAVVETPVDALAHGALASALHAAGDLPGAEEHARAALTLAPANRDMLANLAVICNARADGAQAEELCHAALAQGPDAALLNTLGIALKGQERNDEAADAFEQALALAPGLTQARYNLAQARQDQGRGQEAIALLEQVIAQAPDLAAARMALCMAHLPSLHDSEAAIDEARAAYSRALSDLERWAEHVALAPGVGAAQPFHLAYQGRPDAALAARYGALVCRAMAAAYPPPAMPPPPAPGERLRIGIVCGHIRGHSVWRLPTRGWVQGLDRARFTLLAYHTCGETDDETARARPLFDHFVQGPRSTEGWLEQIAQDRPHVLIYPEIGMDPMVARLAALRLAPVQYASWGHPATSGYPTIDAFLTSEAMEPAGADQHYTERLIRLPGLSTPITVAAAPRAIPSRAALGIAANAVVYWSGQSPGKYRPRDDALLPAIARRVPGSCFVFTALPGSPALTQRLRDRLEGAFRTQGVSPENRIVILPRMPQDAFRAAMGCADVVLDNPGWSGCNSLLDALAHGLPVVTLPGETMPSRHGAAIMRQLGLDEAVVDSARAYVDLAVRLGLEPSTRRAMGQAALARLPALAETQAVAALEAHLLAAFHS